MIEYRKHEQHGDSVGQAIKHTTKYYLKRVVFSGHMITALLLLFQVWLLFSFFFWLDNYTNIYYEGAILWGTKFSAPPQAGHLYSSSVSIAQLT